MQNAICIGVVVESFDTRDEAARARDAFKAKYPTREDFQGAWLLYRVLIM